MNEALTQIETELKASLINLDVKRNKQNTLTIINSQGQVLITLYQPNNDEAGTFLNLAKQDNVTIHNTELSEYINALAFIQKAFRCETILSQ